MAEKIVLPGVFTSEKDLSFLPQAIGEIGAAVIGPTAKGPALVPTLVSNYSEFVGIFGDYVSSGSSDSDRKNYSFLTVDAYKDEEEKKRMFDWNLTAKTIMSVNEWKKFFAECNYKGDYYWFIPWSYQKKYPHTKYVTKFVL